MRLTQYKVHKVEDNGGSKYYVFWLNKTDLEIGEYFKLENDLTDYFVDRKYDTIDTSTIDFSKIEQDVRRVL